MIDVLFVAHNRLEFTKAALDALIRNTDWSAARLLAYDDNSTDGTREFLEQNLPASASLIKGKFGGPVAVMCRYLIDHPGDHVFAKIDNDTMVPPGWLTECQTAFRRAPQLDFVGIEAMHSSGKVDIRPGTESERGYERARHIGGIGLLRTRAFSTCMPKPNGRQGFTQFQLAHPELTIGWLEPAIPVCLLDRMPMEPWLSLSKEYVQKGWQRDCWGVYTPDHHALWDWFHR